MTPTKKQNQTLSDEAAQELRLYLEVVAESHTRLGILQKSADFHYWSREEFLLRHGQQFKAVSNSRHRQRTPGYCFDNSYKIAVSSRGKLNYCEGMAILRPSPIPVHHAWVVDLEGRIIERTWRNTGEAYYGIVVPVNVVKALRSTENTCVLDRWEDGHQLFRRPFKGFDDMLDHWISKSSGGSA